MTSLAWGGGGVAGQAGRGRRRLPGGRGGNHYHRLIFDDFHLMPPGGGRKSDSGILPLGFQPKIDRAAIHPYLADLFRWQLEQVEADRPGGVGAVIQPGDILVPIVTVGCISIRSSLIHPNVAIVQPQPGGQGQAAPGQLQAKKAFNNRAAMAPAAVLS